MNRLYWRNSEGHWGLIIESDNEELLRLKAEHQIAVSPARGVVGYIHWPKAPAYMAWTAYHRYEGGCSRRPTSAADIPKPIKLLEMLNEPHAPA